MKKGIEKSEPDLSDNKLHNSSENIDSNKYSFPKKDPNGLYEGFTAGLSASEGWFGLVAYIAFLMIKGVWHLVLKLKSYTISSKTRDRTKEK